MDAIYVSPALAAKIDEVIANAPVTSDEIKFSTKADLDSWHHLHVLTVDEYNYISRHPRCGIKVQILKNRYQPTSALTVGIEAHKLIQQSFTLPPPVQP